MKLCCHCTLRIFVVVALCNDVYISFDIVDTKIIKILLDLGIILFFIFSCHSLTEKKGVVSFKIMYLGFVKGELLLSMVKI